MREQDTLSVEIRYTEKRGTKEVWCEVAYTSTELSTLEVEVTKEVFCEDEHLPAQGCP